MPGPGAARGLESALWGSKVIDEKHVPGPWEALGAHSNPLIADAPRMLRLLKHLAEILEHNPKLDTQAQIDGENAAAIYIARLRLSEFLAELPGGVK